MASVNGQVVDTVPKRIKELQFGIAYRSSAPILKDRQTDALIGLVRTS